VALLSLSNLAVGLFAVLAPFQGALELITYNNKQTCAAVTALNDLPCMQISLCKEQLDSQRVQTCGLASFQVLVAVPLAWHACSSRLLGDSYCLTHYLWILPPQTFGSHFPSLPPVRMLDCSILPVKHLWLTCGWGMCAFWVSFL